MIHVSASWMAVSCPSHLVETSLVYGSQDAPFTQMGSVQLFVNTTLVQMLLRRTPTLKDALNLPIMREETIANHFVLATPQAAEREATEEKDSVDPAFFILPSLRLTSRSVKHRSRNV